MQIKISGMLQNFQCRHETYSPTNSLRLLMSQSDSGMVLKLQVSPPNITLFTGYCPLVSEEADLLFPAPPAVAFHS